MYLIGAQGTLLSQTSVGLNITVAVRYLIITICISDNHRITKAITSVGVLEDMSLVSTLLEDTILCPWPCLANLVLGLAMALNVKSLALSKVRARLGDKMLADLVYLKCNKRI